MNRFHVQTATSRCYAKSDKSWVADPSGVRWETIHTFGESTTYGESDDAPISVMKPAELEPATAQSACYGAV